MAKGLHSERDAGASTSVALLSLGLTADERATLKEIAARERVTMVSIVRQLLRREFGDFREVSERDEAAHVTPFP